MYFSLSISRLSSKDLEFAFPFEWANEKITMNIKKMDRTINFRI